MPSRQRDSKELAGEGLRIHPAVGPMGINKQLSLKRLEVRADGKSLALARLIPMTSLAVACETVSPAQRHACAKGYSLSIQVADVWKGQPSTGSATEDPAMLGLVFLSPHVLWV